MDVTYLILAHAHPPQLDRLIRSLLRTERDRVVVHVDATVAVEPFSELIGLSDVASRVTFLPERFNIRWGDFASVRATLAALRVAVADHPTDYYVLLSGADYPIRPVAGLHAELLSGAVYMTSSRMPDLEHDKPLTRLQHYFVASKNRSNRIAAVANKLLQRVPARNVQRGLEGYAAFGGSQWWALPDRVARDMLRFVDDHPKLVGFFARSQNPDEMFFQTLVQAVAPDVELRDELTFADWSRPVPPGSPATLVDGEFERIRHAATRYWIARKFDWNRSQTLLDQIDGELLEDALV